MKTSVNLFIPGRLITNDGTAVANVITYHTNVQTNVTAAAWRASVVRPPLALDSSHVNALTYDINRSQTIAGSTDLAQSAQLIGTQAALWASSGSRTDLPTLGQHSNGTRHGTAYDINDSAISIGFSFKYVNNANLGKRPVVWNANGQITELAIPSINPNGIADGEALAINGSGAIVGYGAAGIGFDRQPIRWAPDLSPMNLSLSTQSGLNFAEAVPAAINAKGDVVGDGRIFGGHPGVLWRADGTTIELQDIPNTGVRLQTLYDLNIHAYSVGAADSGQTTRAVRWSPTGQAELLDLPIGLPAPSVSRAVGINDMNYVAGYLGTGPFETNHAAIWTPEGDLIDLNSLLPADSNWTLRRTGTITNTGWVNGVGSFDPAGDAEAYTRGYSMLLPFAGTYGLGDANFDESINFDDLLTVAHNYGHPSNGSVDVGDFNLDGLVDFNDLLVIAQNYESDPALMPADASADFASDWSAARAMIPEPGSLATASFALLMMRRRR